ncbi:MAG: alpha-L-arabinofuranosidase C-terminal domain-containing protein, partial [Clostridia bacterium]|nr:alpha-L-arabinofuranosidase C-terminal domain-containing protein [Clostridia bacterium]
NTKVFLGEYASKGNTWYNALSEAAFMTGLERNADVVRMASYAPMFAKYGNTQWSAANMIWFNNDDYVLTSNYYVQSLFSNNQGDYSLPTEVTLNGIEKNTAFKGGVVLGSWGTHNEFKDFIITSSDKQERADKKNFEAVSGDWKIRDDGVIEQTSDETGCVFYVNRDNLTDYTFTCKARKTAGGEGFQIGVAAEDEKNYYRVNIGGWGNTTAKIQHIVNGVSAEVGNVAEQSYVGSVHINDNECYDVKVEVSDYEIKAYLNGEFICSYTKPQNYGPVYASSVYDEETGDVIVKVVNTIDSDVNVGINVNGANVENVAKTTVMSGDTSLENSLENKNAIVPVEGEITNAANSYTYAAPADSLSVIRLSTEGAAHEPYISGYDDGTFRPDNTITRAEAATIIAKLGGIDESKEYENTFNDVAEDAWHKNYVNFAKEKGYIGGYDDNTFAPDKVITRGEFAVILGRYLGINSNSEWEYMNNLKGKGIISGYEDGSIKPDGKITRAEAVTMINRALGREADINAQNPFSDVTPEHWAYKEILTAVN